MLKDRAVIFMVKGVVEKGKKEANGLGFPTANIPCETGAPSGIYAGEVIWKNATYPAALYKEDGKNVVEAHLLDFSGNLYGQELTFIARKKMREVKKFPEKKELAAAIAQDIKDIKALCSQE